MVGRTWLLSLVVVAGCSDRLTGGLDEASANEAVARLGTQGIGATKVRESGSGEARFAIEVPRTDVVPALAVLEDENLPRRDDPGIAETYGESSLVPSPTEERARYLGAVAGELARTIERIDGVVDARIHLASPHDELRPVDADPLPARASALVRVRPGTRLDRAELRSLIAGAVDGLDPSAVAVVVSTRRPSAPAHHRFRRLGPFQVSSNSFSPLVALLAISLALHVALAATVLVLLRRRIHPRFLTPVPDPESTL